MHENTKKIACNYYMRWLLHLVFSTVGTFNFVIFTYICMFVLFFQSKLSYDSLISFLLKQLRTMIRVNIIYEISVSHSNF